MKRGYGTLKPKVEPIDEEEGQVKMEEEEVEEAEDVVTRTRPIRAAAEKLLFSPKSTSSNKRLKRSVSSTLFGTPFDNCILNLGDNCKKTIENGHRISSTEACCGSCFTMIFRGNDYEAEFVEWKKRSIDGQNMARSDQYVKRFINSQILPYYIRCQKCAKYEKVDSTDSLTATIIKEYTCPHGCNQFIEWSAIDTIRKDAKWYTKNIGFPPLLQNNVAHELLATNYVTRTTGMDVTCQTAAQLVDDGGVPFRDTKSIMNMFYVPYTDVIANIVHPEFMEADEKLAFSKFSDEMWSIYYLQIRNTIIAMWLLHPFSEITEKMVECQIIVRGHARIFLVEHLIGRVLRFLTIKGVVNYGAFDFRIETVKRPLKIAIIGAGLSGMSAARHLKHLGIEPVIFEAQNRTGGRMNDDKTLGVPVGRGAQIIVGNVNNPITLLCEQIGIKYRNSHFFCPLIDESTGKCYTKELKQLDDQVDLHYNNVLDTIRNKFSKDKNLEDQSLEEMFNSISEGLLEAAGLQELNTAEFQKLIDFHLGNLEFSCGAKVGQLSAKEYDHNEKFGNFAGEHAVILDGAQTIVDHLAKGLDVRLNSPVGQIDYSGRKVILHFEDDRESLEFDKVIVTTSLAVLKKNPKMFHPLLPKEKRKAINNLGAGLIEKVAVRFDRRFWSSIDADDRKTEYFGKVSARKEDRSMFNIFYDFTGLNEQGEECFVLMSYVTAEHVNMVNEKNDKEVAKKFVECLKKMFPDEIIVPLGHMVSHWGADQYIGMSYTYVPFDSPGDETYNKLKESVQDKVFFAGEHTIASEPQTMTGAYISGLREAGKVVLSVCRI